MKNFKGTDEKWIYVKSTLKHDSHTISESGKVIGFCNSDSEDDNANEKLRASALELLKVLVALTENIEEWMETGIPADKETSFNLYHNARKAIDDAIY